MPVTMFDSVIKVISSHKIKLCGEVQKMNHGVSQPEESSSSVVWWYSEVLQRNVSNPPQKSQSPLKQKSQDLVPSVVKLKHLGLPHSRLHQAMGEVKNSLIVRAYQRKKHKQVNSIFSGNIAYKQIYRSRFLEVITQVRGR